MRKIDRRVVLASIGLLIGHYVLLSESFVVRQCFSLAVQVSAAEARYAYGYSSCPPRFLRATDGQVSDASHDGDVPSEATYYSPNVALDETRYRYDLDSPSDPATDMDLSSMTTNDYSFFDEAIVYVRAGSGGQGSSTYKKGLHNNQDGKPDGGNGGRGGNVVLVVDDSLNTLAGLTFAWRPNSFGGSGASYSKAPSQQQQQQLRPKSFRAENGRNGERQFKNGKYGKDVVIRVPPGTVVQEEIDQEEETGTRLVDLGSLTLDEPTLVVATGGEGGEGSGVMIGGRGVRRPRVPPTGGQKKRLKLTLKIVADVAIVAVPNAGKSTLLAAVTRAKPKIANYPFTTVIPNLGVWVPPKGDNSAYSSNNEGEGSGSSGLVLCDVPGLIAGAAQGVGLGHAFLRHVERCHVILHLVDATSNDPIADFEMINREIMRYGSGQLGKMPQVVVVNKIDAFDGRAGEKWEEGLETKLTRDELEQKVKDVMPHSRLMWMSAKEREGVDDLMTRLAAFVRKVKETNDA